MNNMIINRFVNKTSLLIDWLPYQYHSKIKNIKQKWGSRIESVTKNVDKIYRAHVGKNEDTSIL